MEIIWFVMGGLFLFIGVESTIDNGFSESWHFLLLALLALIMYYRRRRIRIRNN